MNIVLLGANGQVGQEIHTMAKAQDVMCTAYDRHTCDIRDIAAIQKVLNNQIDCVINATGFTAVDKAEVDEDTFAVNFEGVKNLAQVCQSQNLPLIHLSTDYIFDGQKTIPYQEDDQVVPLNQYGLSKWQGEVAVREGCERHIILRISWVFGKSGHNFVKTILRLAKEKTELKIVNDQLGCPTAAASVAEVILKLCHHIKNGAAHWGTYHYCNTPCLTWYDFAKAILKLTTSNNIKVKEIIPITTADLNLPAVRPAYSVMDCRKISHDYGIEQAPWQPYLEKMLVELNADAVSL